MPHEVNAPGAGLVDVPEPTGPRHGEPVRNGLTGWPSSIGVLSGPCPLSLRNGAAGDDRVRSITRPGLTRSPQAAVSRPLPGRVRFIYALSAGSRSSRFCSCNARAAPSRCFRYRRRASRTRT